MTTVLKVQPIKIALVMLFLHGLSWRILLASKDLTLHSTEAKKQLIELLAEELLRILTNVPWEKKLVITSQSERPLQVHLETKTLRHGMSTTEERTDVIIPQQVTTAIEEQATCVIVISDNTDMFILLLYFYAEWSLSTTVFLGGTGSKSFFHKQILHWSGISNGHISKQYYGSRMDPCEVKFLLIYWYEAAILLAISPF